MSIRKLARWALEGRHRAVCLAFHRVARLPVEGLGPDVRSAVSPELLECVLVELARDFEILSLPALVSAMRTRRRLRRPGLVLTFDDGFADSLHEVLPIAERHGAPFTVYVASGFIDGSVHPYEYRLAHLADRSETLELRDGTFHQRWGLDTAADREACYRDLRGHLRPLEPARRERLMKELWSQGPRGALPRLFLTPDELGALAASPLVTIGSHTRSHEVLTQLNSSDVHAEIRAGREGLERLLSRTVRHFAYPYGAWDPEVRDHVRALDIDSAVTTTTGWVSTRRTDPLSIPRLCGFEIAQLPGRVPDALARPCA